MKRLLLACVALTSCVNVEWSSYTDGCYSIHIGKLELDCENYAFKVTGLRIEVQGQPCKPLCYLKWECGMDTDNDGDIDLPAGVQVNMPDPAGNVSLGTIQGDIPTGHNGTFIARASIWTNCDEDGKPLGEPIASTGTTTPVSRQS